MEKIKVGISKGIFNGSIWAKERDHRPDMVEKGGLYPLLDKLGCEVVEVYQADLTEQDIEWAWQATTPQIT